MGPKTADELIAMAEDSSVVDDEFIAAFLHYAPSADHGYERLLYTMALHRPRAIMDMGLDPAYVQRTADLLHALRDLQTFRSAS